MSLDVLCRKTTCPVICVTLLINSALQFFIFIHVYFYMCARRTEGVLHLLGQDLRMPVIHMAWVQALNSIPLKLHQVLLHTEPPLQPREEHFNQPLKKKNYERLSC